MRQPGDGPGDRRDARIPRWWSIPAGRSASTRWATSRSPSRGEHGNLYRRNGPAEEEALRPAPSRTARTASSRSASSTRSRSRAKPAQARQSSCARNATRRSKAFEKNVPQSAPAPKKPAEAAEAGRARRAAPQPPRRRGAEGSAEGRGQAGRPGEGRLDDGGALEFTPEQEVQARVSAVQALAYDPDMNAPLKKLSELAGVVFDGRAHRATCRRRSCRFPRS